MTTILKGFFVSATDTGVGKTYVSQQLLGQLNDIHDSVKVRKPVESGCSVSTNGELMAADGEALYHANKNNETVDMVTPFRFTAALAPNQAARTQGSRIILDQLESAVRQGIDTADILLVEGAGGIFSPLAEDGLNIDLAKALGLDLILIVDDRLGTINQALMAYHALRQTGVDLFCIILNQVNPSQDDLLDNISELRRYISCPVYHCAYRGTLTDNIFQIP